MSKPYPLAKRPTLKKGARKALRPLPAYVFFHLVEKYQRTDIGKATYPLWYMYKDPCAYCGAVAETWDHLLPKSKYRNEGPHNKAPCCRKCNKKKGARTVLEYLLSLAQEKRYCAKGHPKSPEQKICRVCVATSNRRSAFKRLRTRKRAA